MLKKLLSITLFLVLAQPVLLWAAGTATTYPSDWDKSHKGTPLPNAVRSGTAALDEQFKMLSIGPEEAKDVTWYAPIHSQLGVGKLADPTDRTAISVDQNGLLLQTRDPGKPSGVDVNLQTMNKAGQGFAIQNGYFEVRASLPVAHGSHAGVWLLSRHEGPGHGEIDVVESYGVGDPNVHSSVHWWPRGQESRFAKHVFLGKGFFRPDVAFQGTLHNYGVLLTPENIIFYFDQKETRRIARLPEQQVPFYLVLSLFTDPGRKDGYEPAVMRIAHVRVWEMVQSR